VESYQRNVTDEEWLEWALNVLHNKDDLGWRATAAEAQTAHCNAAAVWWGWGDGSEGSNLTTTPTEPLFNSISTKSR